MNQDDYIKLIYRYLKQEASENEVKQMEELRDSSESHSSVFHEIVSTWHLSNTSDIISKEEVAQDYAKIKSRINTTSQNGRRLFFRISSIAASFLIIAGSIWSFNYFRHLPNKSHLASEGTNYTFPDGSTITLEEGAEVKHSRSFKRGRNTILYGNAFFDNICFFNE